MTRFVLKNTFIKIYVPFFDKYFNKNKELKLGLGNRVTVLNDFQREYLLSKYTNNNKSSCSTQLNISSMTLKSLWQTGKVETVQSRL